MRPSIRTVNTASWATAVQVLHSETRGLTDLPPEERLHRCTLDDRDGGDGSGLPVGGTLRTVTEASGENTEKYRTFELQVSGQIIHEASPLLAEVQAVIGRIHG